MPVRKHKPTTPGRRFATWADHSEVTKKEPEGAHRGQGQVRRAQLQGPRDLSPPRRRGQRRYRKIDFKRRKDGVQAKVAAIEYDPNRSAYIALLHYADGDKRYILARPGCAWARR